MTINPSDLSSPSDIRLSKVPVHDATALTQGGNQALITLGDQLYNLRITRAGKLILTK